MTSITARAGAVARQTASRLQMLVLAGAVALAGVTATATPARSDADDLVRFLFGIAAAAVIIGAIDDRHRPRYIDRWTLPASCQETARVRRDGRWRNVAVYNARCLSRAGYSGLPRRCHIDLRVERGHRASYVAQCLYRAGYRAEGTHTRPRPPAVVQPSPGHRPHRASRLPSHCEMTYRQDGRRVAGYEGRCLYNAGFSRLPGACRVRDRAGNTYYNRQCLLNNGYRR